MILPTEAGFGGSELILGGGLFALLAFLAWFTLWTLPRPCPRTPHANRNRHPHTTVRIRGVHSVPKYYTDYLKCIFHKPEQILDFLQNT